MKKMKRLEYRRVHEKGYFGVTEVSYDKKGNLKSHLKVECGILSYWMTPKELQVSYNNLKVAFEKPIIDLDNWPNEYEKKNNIALK